MKFYSLSNDDETNWEWRAILPANEDQKFGVISKINSDEKIELGTNEKLKFHLINTQRDVPRRSEIPFESDVIYWTNDLTLNTFSAANGIIVSDKLLNALKKFHLPSYFEYPLDIINIEDQSISSDYWLVQFITPIKDFTDFSKSHYAYRPKRSKEIIRTEIGTFNSYEEYINAERISRREQKIYIDICKRSWKVNYDVAWAYLNSIVINETTENGLSSIGLLGVHFNLFTEFEIMLGE